MIISTERQLLEMSCENKGVFFNEGTSKSSENFQQLESCTQRYQQHHIETVLVSKGLSLYRIISHETLLRDLVGTGESNT